MVLEHQMGASEKLREIIRLSNCKQKDLAGKFGVSAKTVSFWVNGKRPPSKEQVKRIDTLYTELACRKLDKHAAMPELVDIQIKNEIDELEEGLNIDESDYFKAKALVYAREPANNTCVYLFPAKVKGDADAWYIVGGHSMLFYKYFLAPRLGREMTIRDDMDKLYRFAGGVGSVRWGSRLIEQAKKLNYNATRIEYGIIVIELGKIYSDQEMKHLSKLASGEKRKARQIIKPKIVLPELEKAIERLVQVLPSKVRKLDVAYREVIGEEMLRPIIELEKLYYRLANGHMDKREARLAMLERIDDFMGVLAVLDECQLVTLAARTRMGENAVDIRERIEKDLT